MEVPPCFGRLNADIHPERCSSCPANAVCQQVIARDLLLPLIKKIEELI